MYTTKTAGTLEFSKAPATLSGLGMLCSLAIIRVFPSGIWTNTVLALPYYNTVATLVIIQRASSESGPWLVKNKTNLALVALSAVE